MILLIHRYEITVVRLMSYVYRHCWLLTLQVQCYFRSGVSEPIYEDIECLPDCDDYANMAAASESSDCRKVKTTTTTTTPKTPAFIVQWLNH